MILKKSAFDLLAKKKLSSRNRPPSLGEDLLVFLEKIFWVSVGRQNLILLIFYYAIYWFVCETNFFQERLFGLVREDLPSFFLENILVFQQKICQYFMSGLSGLLGEDYVIFQWKYMVFGQKTGLLGKYFQDYQNKTFKNYYGKIQQTSMGRFCGLLQINLFVFLSSSTGIERY